MFRSTKTYTDLPCAHRQWRDKGHCAWVHGYSRSFSFNFVARELSEEHFVMNFGDLKKLKIWLEDHFDHTLLICADDPHLETFRTMHTQGLCKLVVLPNVSMEATAYYVWQFADELVYAHSNGRVRVASVECRENRKNSGLYICPELQHGFAPRAE